METNPNISQDAEILAFKALGWVLEDQDRAQRLLALTGLDPRQLRSGLEDPAMLASLIVFLANHEPDLVACAEAIDVDPAHLMAASSQLSTPGESL